MIPTNILALAVGCGVKFEQFGTAVICNIMKITFESLEGE